MGLRFEGVRGLPSAFAVLRAYIRASSMLARGAFTKPWFHHSRGPLFRGRAVSVMNASFISHRGRLVLEDFVELQGVSKRGITFGSNVSIGRGTMIRPSSYYGGEAGEGMKMGDRSSIGAGGFLGCSGWIEIGSDVMMGPGVRIFSEDHVFETVETTIKEQGVTRGETVIEDDCWIGSGVTITSGVRVGRGSVIAAGSVVTKDVPAFSVTGGVPARLIRSRESV